jgi:hypothetical protein
VSRRRVRVSSIVFDSIDEALPAERGPNGEPSAGDFVANELPSIVERFAVDFDELHEVDGLSGTRELIAAGTYVRAFAAYGMLQTDDTVELISISIEL